LKFVINPKMKKIDAINIIPIRKLLFAFCSIMIG
jgi:hypothetical protein